MNLFKLLFTFIFISNCTFAQTQNEKVDVRKWLATELVKHLRPGFTSNDTTEILVFTVKPEVKPDSCFRIIESKGQTYLEVRFLDKNIWQEIGKKFFFEHNYDPLSLNVHFYSIPISISFKNRILNIFAKTITLNEEMMKLPSKYDVFDGTFYGFKINSKGKITETTVNDDSELYQMASSGKHDLRYLVKTANLKIINDLKNGTFKESNYEIYK